MTRLYRSLHAHPLWNIKNVSNRMKKKFSHLFPKIVTRINERVVWPLKTMFAAETDYRRARTGQHGARIKTMVCYPEKPKTFHALYKIAHRLGYRITNKLDPRADCIIRFEDTTYGTSFPELDTLAHARTVINARCTDISKRHVEEVFHEVFGYGMKIDPRHYTGTCVQKSDMNALHDGKVITCPTEPKEGYIYQRLIHNNVDADTAEDLRLLIMQGTIPFVARRFKHTSDRFNETVHAEVVETVEVLTPEEVRLVHIFCERMGLDYGEIDSLRDRTDGKLYLIDVNNTPSGPMGTVYEYLEGSHLWVTRMAQAFKNTFLDVA